MLRKSHKGGVMGTNKILIVEDEPNMVAGLRDNFEYEGFQVITALDGVEGLDKARRDDAAHERVGCL
jgi:DNA-binding response OmpR family regulator